MCTENEWKCHRKWTWYKMKQSLALDKLCSQKFSILKFYFCVCPKKRVANCVSVSHFQYDSPKIIFSSLGQIKWPLNVSKYRKEIKNTMLKHFNRNENQVLEIGKRSSIKNSIWEIKSYIFYLKKESPRISYQRSKHKLNMNNT